MKKNDLTELTIEEISSEGFGIGQAVGMAVFVKDAVPGDRVCAKVVKVKKTCAYARLEEILSPGPDRVPPVCPSARRCGGCQIQELSYPAQLRLKERRVRENLIRIGGFHFHHGSEEEAGYGAQPDVEPGIETPDSDGFELTEGILQPILGMQDPWHYRNKAQFPIGTGKDGRIIAGFYAGRTHTIIDHHQCEIGIGENRIILETVIAWMNQYKVPAYDEETGSGVIRHVMTRAGFSTGELMIVIVAAVPKLKEEKRLVELLLKAFEGKKLELFEEGRFSAQPEAFEEKRSPKKNESSGNRFISGNQGFCIRSIVLNVNREKTNVILGRESRVLYGADFIEDRIKDLRCRISSKSFYQVNPLQTVVLYQTALDYAALTGTQTVWDLYCGTGTISLFLARKARHVIGVEVIPEAVENARQNASLNRIGNCEFLVGKAEELAPTLPPADVIVVDPPRKGLDRVVIDTILRAGPDRIVYVSCDSATLARDLARFVTGGYQVRKVQPVDQFCHTVHVETVVLMSKVKE